MDEGHPTTPLRGLGLVLALVGLLVLARVVVLGVTALTLLALSCWACALLAIVSRRRERRP